MKSRKSNFELLRIVAMMLVMLVHVNYLSLGNVSQSEAVATPCTGFIRVFCEQLCIVSVNLFILLSGWFGIRPTIKKAASLLFQVMFIGSISMLISKCVGAELSAEAIGNFAWFGQSYWFIPSYLILFFFAPVLNAFCERADRREFTTVIISFFVLEGLFGWLNGDAGHYMLGYSAISFMGLYLLAQYIRRYGGKLLLLKWWQSFLFYLLFTTIPSLMAFGGLYANNNDLSAISYSSLFVIASSVSLLLMFSQFDFESKVINWLSASAFAIYLVHQAPGMTTLYVDFFKDSYHAMNGALFIPFAILATVVIGLACILFDKVRIALWEQLLRCVQKRTN